MSVDQKSNSDDDDDDDGMNDSVNDQNLAYQCRF